MTGRPAMIFGAGFGTRMGALTTDRPKPLIEVAGRALIDHALALVRDAGAGPVVVNAHYKAGMLAAHLADAGVTVTVETPGILDTGGGLKRALPMLGGGAVFTLNPDCIWRGPNPLRCLERGWAPGMDALLLVVPRARAVAHGGAGDFAIAADGRLGRGGDYVYTGAQILCTDRLGEIGKDVFSLNEYWDLLGRGGGLHGLVYDGAWCDVGHPDGIGRAEALLRGAMDV